MKLLHLVIAIMALTSFGCSPEYRRYQVKIVVPNEYNGLVRILFRADGEPEKWDGRTRVLKIPKSGILVTKGANPFLKWGNGMMVVREDNTPVDCAFRMQTPDENRVLFRDIGGTNDGKEYWAVIGTASQAREASLKLGEHQSARP